MEDKRIKFQSDIKNKGVCSHCGRATCSVLTIPSGDTLITEIHLCDRCILDLLDAIYIKRQDLIDDLLMSKMGTDTRAIEENLEEVSSLRDEVDDLKCKLKEEFDKDYYSDEEEDNDYDE